MNTTKKAKRDLAIIMAQACGVDRHPDYRPGIPQFVVSIGSNGCKSFHPSHAAASFYAGHPKCGY